MLLSLCHPHSHRCGLPVLGVLPPCATGWNCCAHRCWSPPAPLCACNGRAGQAGRPFSVGPLPLRGPIPALSPGVCPRWARSVPLHPCVPVALAACAAGSLFTPRGALSRQTVVVTLSRSEPRPPLCVFHVRDLPVALCIHDRSNLVWKSCLF